MTNKRAPRPPRGRVPRNRLIDRNRVPHLSFCDRCRKKAFDRDAAKKLARILPGERPHVYRCPHWNEMLGWWHVGSLPKQVRTGHTSAQTVYAGEEGNNDQ